MEALRGWKAHIGAGVEIVPDGARVAVGDTVLLLIKTAGLWAAAPCRVVYVVDEPNRFSFAYGTLPGHPEQGEAAMIVERDEVGGVVFRIVSFLAHCRSVRPARLAYHASDPASGDESLCASPRKGKRACLLI